MELSKLDQPAGHFLHEDSRGGSWPYLPAGQGLNWHAPSATEGHSMYDPSGTRTTAALPSSTMVPFLLSLQLDAPEMSWKKP